ncbi:transmembrane protein 215 [Callorhinchus milii]|uniref:Transmembrane protein 215 n=1 Tax=Callorhinchus milii TaxID=7868 RepID=A0A4W3INB3_CALMI|nr:transmembrane protein 215 [Callorhinchus milii]|eukprot:gi/632976476/ref/XP_007904815.1/ PREDICTED: transmembrane protein 215 [Callorhinchus milii]
MRPDNINPRTGLVVALVSVFLVFGFMFTVSGVRGETLGGVPLIAIGPAIFLPGLAAIILAKKTDGCTKWPPCPPYCRSCRSCHRLKEEREDELLRAGLRDSGWEGSSHQQGLCKSPGSEDRGSQTDSSSLIPKGEQEVARRFLETFYPAGVFNQCALGNLCPNRNNAFYTSVYSTRDSVIYAPPTQRDSVPYGRYYCCYPSPGEPRHIRFCWDYETIV